MSEEKQKQKEERTGTDGGEEEVHRGDKTQAKKEKEEQINVTTF